MLEVLTYPHPILRQKAQAVETFDAALAALAQQMLEAMYANEGIGLAAPQVGQSVRLVVMDLGAESDDPAQRVPQVFVNPRLLEKSGEGVMEEGCLSVPDYKAEVKRASYIVLRYQTLTGEERTEALEGLPAVVLQHEIDHLEGRLFIDHLSPVKRDLIKKRLTRQQRNSA